MKKYLELVSKDEALQKKIAKAEAEYKANLIKESIKLADKHGITPVESEWRPTRTPARFLKPVGRKGLLKP